MNNNDADVFKTKDKITFTLNLFFKNFKNNKYRVLGYPTAILNIANNKKLLHFLSKKHHYENYKKITIYANIKFWLPNLPQDLGITEEDKTKLKQRLEKGLCKNEYNITDIYYFENSLYHFYNIFKIIPNVPKIVLTKYCSGNFSLKEQLRFLLFVEKELYKYSSIKSHYPVIQAMYYDLNQDKEYKKLKVQNLLFENGKI